MQTLNLNVEDGVGIYVIAVHLLDVLGELNLLLSLDLIELVDGSGVAAVVENAELAQVGKPLVAANLLGDEVGKLGVAQTEPAALCDAVCLVEEALGINLVPLLEQISFKDLGVELGYAVYICAGIGSKSCHVNRVAVDNAHLGANIRG